MQTPAVSRQNTIVAMWSEMDRWVVPAAALMGGTLPDGWEIAKVGEVVELMTERIQVEPDRDYKMAGVRWYGEGVFHRETVSGKKLSAKYIAPLKPSAFIYNRLFGWKASFAVVPESLADCYVSNEFPQFVTDKARLIPEYLYLWAICESTIRAVNAASTGSAAVSRNRFREEFFLEFDIPLPPLGVQQAIVSAWEQAKSKIANIQERIFALEEQIEIDFLAALGLPKPKRATLPKSFGIGWKDLDRWGLLPNQLAANTVDIHKSKYPVKSGRTFIENIKHGCSASPSLKPTSLKVLKISAVTKGYFDLNEQKYMHDRKRFLQEFDLKQGDVLMCRTNGTLSLVGMSALVEQDLLNTIFPDKVIRVRTNENVNPAYLWKALQMEFARSQIQAAARTAVGNYAIGSQDIWDIKMPMPPLSVQRKIVDKVMVQRKTISYLKTEAEMKSTQAKADIEAMILGNKPVPDAN